MKDWILTLPFACALLWAIGGRESGRYFRRIGVGLAVAVYCYIFTEHYLSFCTIFTYWIVTSIGYGKVIAKRNWLVLFLIGLGYGYACFPVYAIGFASIFFIQGPIAALVFTGLTYWSNTGPYKLHWAFCEGFTGLGATILVPWMIIA